MATDNPKKKKLTVEEEKLLTPENVAAEIDACKKILKNTIRISKKLWWI